MEETFDREDKIEEISNNISLGYAIDKAIDAAFEIMWQDIKSSEATEDMYDEIFGLLNERLYIGER